MRHYARTHKNTGQINSKDKAETAARKIPGRLKLGARIFTFRKQQAAGCRRRAD